MFAVDEASAKALSDYMAKSHEERLKIVKQTEHEKKMEISALKEEIQALKASALVTNEYLEAKVASYQDFIAKYIVDTHNQKLLAVHEAENKFRPPPLNKSASVKVEVVTPVVEKNMSDKLAESAEIKLQPPPPNGDTAETKVATSVVEKNTFDKPDEIKVVKSRWGAVTEVQKVQTTNLRRLAERVE